MTYIPNAGGVVSQTLGSAWANAGTITFSYPTGFVQADFTAGLAVPNGSYMMVNQSDKVLEDISAATGIALSFGSTTITVTNNTGASIAAGSKIDLFANQQDGNAAETIIIPVSALSDVGNADIVSGIRLGIDGYIENFEYIQGKPVTTGSKLATVVLKIGSTAVTGASIALTSALCTPLGARIASTQITAANRITKKDALSLTASSVTAFVEGSGFFAVRIRRDSL